MAQWITDCNADTEKITLTYFRKIIEVVTLPERCEIQITADTRYKLYINEKLCEVGPLKGDQKLWFYDSFDVAPYLKKGNNVISVKVLHYPEDCGNMSLISTNQMGLYIRGNLIETDESWKVFTTDHYEIIEENPFFSPLYIYETTWFDENDQYWMQESFAEDNWRIASAYVPDAVQREENLAARSIPFLYRKSRMFESVSRVNTPCMGQIHGCNTEEETFRSLDAFLSKKGELTIRPHSVFSFDIDAGELMTGYLYFSISGGKNSQIRLHQAECYVDSLPEIVTSFDDHPIKKDRTNKEKGLISPYTDTYTVTGCEEERYSPFWFRTFRYIRMEITTAEEPLRLCEISYEETGYPLQVSHVPHIEDKEMKKIWDISLRSLRRCMHETYEDCPFYEQLQYAMDTRSQILYTYVVSGDDRLARKAIDDFSRSQREDGMIACSYPNKFPGVIPGFSIYYIGMLYDHMQYFGDKELIRRYLPTVDRILGFFRKHMDPRGLVGKVGDLNRPGCDWSFIDWTEEWRETNGVPRATLSGPITIESLLYILGLQYAQELHIFIGEREKAAEYQVIENTVKTAVNLYCRDREGVYIDGPGILEYSQHTQVFALLTDTAEPEEGKRNLTASLEERNKFSQCSVAMKYYLFRALEKSGMYEKTKELWDPWREMIKNHMTTCAEDDVYSRSDCHAWGALALYEFR